MKATTRAADKPLGQNLSVQDLLISIFPQVGGAKPGNLPYMAFPNLDGSQPDAYATPPLLPPDTFAAAAQLLEISGAYHHVIPKLVGRPNRVKRQIVVEESDIALARQVARCWRSFRPEQHADPIAKFADWVSAEGSAIRHLFDWWHAVFSQHGAAPAFARVSAQTNPPPWWRAAVFLMMASDEAAKGIGFQLDGTGSEAPDETETPWTSFVIAHQIVRTIEKQTERVKAPRAEGIQLDGVSTISTASPDVLAVLPKARTAAVGCTLRSLSHHLAILPPRGVARASWTPYLFGELPADEEHMNLLLVPFPFSVPIHSFRPKAQFAGEGFRWGYFDVEQEWLSNLTSAKLLEFIQALVTEAKKDCNGIHAVVFPELALNDALYLELSVELPKILPEIELFIAGQSGAASARSGNFVSVTLYQQDPTDRTRKRGLISRREKHHRWKLDRYQILDYGLEGILSPSMSWWEDIDLLSRRVDFSVVRSGSVVSAMICEDLARVDPCQELLRAVGPSIVFALLMDAPQIRVRWPARYATILAEDPGSAVLTMTSRALMTRQHRIGTHLSKGPSDRVIALWRDDTGDPQEIECPNDAHGVRLTLSGRRVIDETLDGRTDTTAVSWRYAKHKPIKIKDVVKNFSEILGADDVALQAAGTP